MTADQVPGQGEGVPRRPRRPPARPREPSALGAVTRRAVVPSPEDADRGPAPPPRRPRPQQLRLARNKPQTFPRSLAPPPGASTGGRRGGRAGGRAHGPGEARKRHFGFRPRRPQPRGPRPCPWAPGVGVGRGEARGRGGGAEGTPKHLPVWAATHCPPPPRKSPSSHSARVRGKQRAPQWTSTWGAAAKLSRSFPSCRGVARRRARPGPGGGRCAAEVARPRLAGRPRGGVRACLCACEPSPRTGPLRARARSLALPLAAVSAPIKRSVTHPGRRRRRRRAQLGPARPPGLQPSTPLLPPPPLLLPPPPPLWLPPLPPPHFNTRHPLAAPARARSLLPAARRRRRPQPSPAGPAPPPRPGSGSERRAAAAAAMGGRRRKAAGAGCTGKAEKGWGLKPGLEGRDWGRGRGRRAKKPEDK